MKFKNLSNKNCHPELVSALHGREPLTRISNAHIHSQRTAPSPTRGEGKEGSVVVMKENNFPDTDFSRFTSHFSLKSAAFTLAEVLVTLGIIGVVSAMTVPTLMQNYQQQSMETQLHKVYNEVSQALLRYQTDRNAINYTEAGLSSDDALDSFVRTYFKVVQNCGETQTPCFPAQSEYKTKEGGNISGWNADRHFVLASGAAIGLRYKRDGEQIAEMVVDINGKKGPNIQGRDLCKYSITNTELKNTCLDMSEDPEEVDCSKRANWCTEQCPCSAGES